MVVRTARSWPSSPVVAEKRACTEVSTATGLTAAVRPTAAANRRRRVVRPIRRPSRSSATIVEGAAVSIREAEM